MARNKENSLRDGAGKTLHVTMGCRAADGKLSITANVGHTTFVQDCTLAEAEQFHEWLSRCLSKAKSDRRAGYKVEGEPGYERVTRRRTRPEV